ncbi:DNA sulfur modification protein DndD [Nakamurella panacisegetis]|uniref:Nuclease SbcCD subunit C n=1 Tax=Nakamurella panacisegetis TaxID=1090615 RepID=A0A1H0ITR9_9ACTN|nr:DNA sulfur modification protein DndD [Nakamurella panacisegetis]SDO34610.1 DNA sulfur modification protein DndD [Nakamurella panacisegetis]
MILDELVLHNVGTFAGRHSIPLTPPSTKKPVVLIGGLNGAGKTTVLEAIHVALYGALAQPSGRRSGSYDSYLRSLIHRGVPETEGAAIELTFHAHQEGEERRFWIRRSWRSTGAYIREILLVMVDGRHDHALTSTWSEHVETFLPRGIAGLFFFDGEQIEALADMERSRQVLGSALAALLGLDLVERLTTDLAVLRRRHRSQQVPDVLRETVQERQRTVTSLRQAEEAAADAVATVRVELERSNKRLFELAERYRSAGGDLLDQRDSAETTVTLLRTELARIEDEIRSEVSEAAPLLQTTELLRGLSEQVHRESAAHRELLVVDVVEKRDAAVLAQLASDAVNAVTLRSIEQFLTADRDERAKFAQAKQVSGLRDAGGTDALLRVLPSARRRLEGLLERRIMTRSELDQAERVLVAMPDPETLVPLRIQRDEAAAETIRAESSLEHASERLTSLRTDRARADSAYEGALDKAAHANMAADDGRRLIEHVDRVRVTLEGLRAAATRRHLDRISELILEALGRLLRKDKLITAVAIDADSHTVELTGLDGRPLAAQELSAGERQLLAVALLWGLARAAGQPLPVIIDTPLGRLDGSHREHLLDRYFPYASHQVILLSTDTEIDRSAYDRLRPHIGRAYRLEFNPKTNATAVQPGYFWE